MLPFLILLCIEAGNLGDPTLELDEGSQIEAINVVLEILNIL